jgi:hypothetical protein
MKWIVNNRDGYATSLASFAGSNLTLANNSAVDVYYTTEAGGGALNSTAPGIVPTGTKLVASTGFVQFQDAPHSLWVRAISQTQLDVQADAPNTRPGSKQTVYPGQAILPNNKDRQPRNREKTLWQKIFG